jgi:hypothetical protein
VQDQEAEALTTSPLLISNNTPSNGETITVMSLVAGGSPPYTYTITFDPPGIIEAIEPAASTNGVLQASVPISAPIDSETNVTFQIEVVDSENRTATIAGGEIVVSPQ